MADTPTVSLDLLGEPWPVRRFDLIDSTSAEAHRFASEGREGPIWFRADQQTAGKGRTGRQWISEPGNLYTTALIPIRKVDKTVPLLALTIGMAVRDTFHELSAGRLSPGLKWPNDVRVREAKISGILLETGSNDSGGVWLSVGIGLNLLHAPDLNDYRTTSIFDETGLKVSTDSAMIALDRAVRARLKQHMLAGAEAIVSDWLGFSDQIDKRCRIKHGSETIEGLFVGLDAFGQLRLRTDDGETVTITAGDVNLVRETSHASGN